MRTSGARARVSLWILIFLSCVTSILPVQSAFAAFTASSLTLTAITPGTTDGGSKPGGVVNNVFSFASNAAIGSSNAQTIEFQYCVEAEPLTSCTNAAGAGVGNIGMSTTGTTATGLSGNLSGWTLSGSSTNGDPYLTHAATTIASGTMTVTLTSITNPSAANKTFYVRMKVWTGATPGAGSLLASSVVAASTANPIVLNGTMPESLIFCTGGTITNQVTGNTTLPDCSTASSAIINFNQLFSSQATATATSQMAASTNAGSGYVITYTADTLKNGSSNPIPAINGGSGTATALSIGTSEFGLNLAANTTPAAGAVKYSPTISGGSFIGAVDAVYATPNSFAFKVNTATTVAAATGPVDLERYTVTYAVDASGSLAAGTYATTLTYICTPTF
jgi:hypothetical protein